MPHIKQRMLMSRDFWLSRRDAHRARMVPWVEDHRQRAERGVKHPVYDFLFTYYSLRPAHLLRWSPGVDVPFEAARDELDWNDFEINDGIAVLPKSKFPEHRRRYLEWAIAYLHSVRQREPQFGCFGLHEWAMVYRTPEKRHATPLRLPLEQIDAVVDSQGLRCTHYDAFRFFTPPAMPRNRIELTRATAIEHDQPGCIHATMDLYKFAYTVAPFVSSELTADCFELAVKAREIDMRASPYDLAGIGFPPIRIETKTGREEYVLEQKALAAAAEPLRLRMISEYEKLVL